VTNATPPPAPAVPKGESLYLVALAGRVATAYVAQSHPDAILLTGSADAPTPNATEGNVRHGWGSGCS
jgi:hypothetical protein